MKNSLYSTIMIILAILSLVFLIKDIFDLSMILLYVLLIMSIIFNFKEEKIKEEVKDGQREISTA